MTVACHLSLISPIAVLRLGISAMVFGVYAHCSVAIISVSKSGSSC